MLVFDKWTCNTNGRQTLFFRPADDPENAGKYAKTPDPYDSRYMTLMIDQGFCFNAGEWNYPDAPLRGLYTRNRVYEGITGMESFGPWVARIQTLASGFWRSMLTRFPRNGTRTIKTRCMACWRNYTAGDRESRNCCWQRKTATGSRFQTGASPASAGSPWPVSGRAGREASPKRGRWVSRIDGACRWTGNRSMGK